MRIEKDSIGEKQLPKNALYGIHTIRAIENFPDKMPFHIEWYKAIGIVKHSFYKTALNFNNALKSKHPDKIFPFQILDNNILKVLSESALEVSEGKFFNEFLIPSISGGAGTSINMNINEIITNVSLLKMNKNIGDYNFIDPIESANIYQSTNDVIPTSLKVAVMFLLNDLEISINAMRQQLERIEQSTRNSLRIGYTQMQEAVPTSFGKLFSTYNEALSRDWWRVSKCFERIKVVNIGGSAIGTGITVPRYVIMEVASQLQKITGLPVTRSENLMDATANLDSLVEVHAILKAYAVNLEKMVSDIRLLSSDIRGIKEISIPACQTGSSIMPGKINPVIPEFVICVSHKVYCNDQLITSLCAQGCLELNAYLPIIGHALLDSIKLLIAAGNTLNDNLLQNIKINETIAKERLYNSSVITTALVPFIGYNKASELAKEMKNSNINIFEANDKLNFIDKNKLKTLLTSDNLLKTGFSIAEL